MGLPLIGLLGFAEGFGKETALIEKERMAEEAQAKRDETLNRLGIERDAAQVRAQEESKRREHQYIETEGRSRRERVNAALEKYRAEGIEISDSDIVREIRGRKRPMDIIGTGATGDSVNLQNVSPEQAAIMYEDAGSTPETKGIIAKSIGMGAAGTKRAPTAAEINERRLELQESEGLISAADATRSRDTRSQHQADREQRTQLQEMQFRHLEAMQQLTDNRIREEGRLGREQQAEYHRERMQIMRDQMEQAGMQLISGEKGAYIYDKNTKKATPILDADGKQIKSTKDDDSFKLINALTKAAEEANKIGEIESAKRYMGIVNQAISAHMKTHGGGEAPRTPTKPIESYDPSNRPAPRPAPAAAPAPAATPPAEETPSAATPPSRASGIINNQSATVDALLARYGRSITDKATVDRINDLRERTKLQGIDPKKKQQMEDEIVDLIMSSRTSIPGGRFLPGAR